MHRRHFTVALCLLAWTACDRKTQRPRCARCGMYTDVDRSFGAHVGDQLYDTPKCLWRDLLVRKGKLSEAQVTDYYSGTKTSAKEAFYVVDSDVLGPMGADLVPHRNEVDARRFGIEHGGRIVKAPDIDAEMLAPL